jgi:hypothetical protein
VKVAIMAWNAMRTRLIIFFRLIRHGLCIDEQVACLALGPIIRVGIVHTREWFNVQSSMSL